MKKYWLFVAFILILGIGVRVKADSLDLNAIADIGTNTAQKLLNTPAAWELTTTLPSGQVIRVSIVRAGSKQRTIFAYMHGDEADEFYKIISRDDMWYVSGPSGDAKYRPCEAPAEGQCMYLLLKRSQPVFARASILQSARYEKFEANCATFRRPVDPINIAQLQAALNQYESLVRQYPKANTRQLQTLAAAEKDLIANGIPLRVDISTGMMIGFGTPRLYSEIDNFRFLKDVPEDEFSITGHQWQDFSDDPTDGNLNDLIMIAQQPGDKKYDMDGRLMDVCTGRSRRIPFPGAAVIPGCFLQDRRSVIVAGLDANLGSLRPYRIDLKTRKCTSLGGSPLDHGMTLIGDLSPDGSMVAVTHMDPTIPLLSSQIYLIDVTTGTAKPLGQPFDTTTPSWTADGTHLVLTRRTTTDMNAPPDSSLATMDMEGHVVELRSGNSPVLMADRQTILFRDNDALWHTCDLKGNDEKLYGDGLAGYRSAAPAPDGKRMIMTHFINGALSVPEVLQIGQSSGQPITQEEGIWATPAWR